MEDRSLALLFRDAPQDFARVVAWYLFAIRWAHPERLNEEFGAYLPLLQKLSQASRRYEYALSRFVLRQSGVDDPHPPLVGCQIWMLRDGASWERLFLQMGLVVYASSIAREIRGDRVRQLCSMLGDQGYRWAVKKVPFLGQREFAEKPLPENMMDLVQHCIQEGMALVLRAGEPFPVCVHSRLLAILSQHFANFWSRTVPSQYSQDKCADLLRHILVWERGQYG